MERKTQVKMCLILAAAWFLLFAHSMRYSSVSYSLPAGLTGTAGRSVEAATLYEGTGTLESEPSAHKQLCLPAICPADRNVKKNYTIRGEEESEGDGVYLSFEDSFPLFFAASRAGAFGPGGESFYACLRSCFMLTAGILCVIRIIHEMDGKKKGFAAV